MKLFIYLDIFISKIRGRRIELSTDAIKHTTSHITLDTSKINQTISLKLYEFCNKNLDKRVSSSDWNKDINELSDKQLEYAANDVVFLHKIKNELEKMLKRENRMDLYKNCITFLDTRIKLDQSGFKFDIFEH